MDRSNQLSNSLKRKLADVHLVENKKAKAMVWKGFHLITERGVLVEGYTACIKCLSVLKYKNADGVSHGTSTLKSHADKCGNAVATATPTQVITRVLSTYKLTSIQRNHLKTDQAKYVCVGNHSMLSVENPGLIQLMQRCVNIAGTHGSFDVGAALYGRKTVGEEITTLAETVKGELKQALVEPIAASAIGLTTDLFTDDYMKRAYLDVHVFWITEDLVLKNCIAAVHHFGTDKHTGDNIYETLQTVFEEFGLKDKDLLITTDKGANIVKALRDKYGRLDCANHRLHTCFDTAWKMTKDEEPDAAQYESAVSALCAYVKMATAIQEQLPVTLKHGGDTRPWTSMDRRCRSIDASYSTLFNTVRREKIHLVTAVDRELNRALIPITGSVASAMKKLEMSNHPTCHLNLPTYYVVTMELHPKREDPDVIKALKRNLFNLMGDKYWDSISGTHILATFLDPTFRNFEFIEDQNQKKQTLSDLNDILAREMMFQVNANVPEADVADADAELPVLSKDPFAALRQRVHIAPGQEASQQKFKDELRRYRNGQFICVEINNDEKEDARCDPLPFWRLNMAGFPMLTKLVRKTLCIPGSSATSERDFSSVGLTITDKRSRLSPKRVEAIQLVKAGISSGFI